MAWAAWCGLWEITCCYRPVALLRLRGIARVLRRANLRPRLFGENIERIGFNG